MRYLLLLLALLTFTCSAQNVSVKVMCQETWPPGKSVPVTVEIVRGDAEGFARFYQNLPDGFNVENVNSGGADFFRDNSQVNFVWVDLPDVAVIRIQYLAKADQLLSGSFKLSGRLDYIRGESKRVSVYADPLIIRLDKSATVESIGLMEKVEPYGQQLSKDDVDPVDPSEKAVIDFRIQVSISSQRFSQEELEDRIGCKLREGVTVLKTGSMFKYQSGSFESYDSASAYLDELKRGGVTDAFVVAFMGNSQISIKEAREIVEK